MRELTSGRPVKLILSFAMPIIIGRLFQQLYSMIDMIAVGRVIGVDALAAIGSTSYLSNLIIGFVSGLTSGFSIITARHFGAGDHVKMRRAVAGTIILGTSVSLIFTAVSVKFLRVFLRLLNTPEDIFETAYSYIVIILFFLTVTMLYNMASGVLRAVGDTVTPLVFLVISSFINIGLDLLFILVFDMGVKGAAYATVISQGVSCVLCIGLIFLKFPYLIPSKEEFLITSKEIYELFSMGLSLAMMFSIVEIGSLILQGAINTLGTVTIAAHTAARKITSMLMLPFASISSACSTFCSQNLGAKKFDRIGRGIKSGLLICWIWAGAVVLIGWFAAPYIVALMAGSDKPEVIRLASLYLRFNTPFYFVLAILNILRSSFQGMGRKILPIASSVIELLGKAAAAFILTPVMGYRGIIISEPAVWILMAILLAVGYVSDRELMRTTFSKAADNTESIDKSDIPL